MLGMPEAICDGNKLKVPRGHTQTTLAALVTSKEPLQTEVLIELIWTGTPPPHADVQVRGYISTLRRIFRDACGDQIIEGDGSGYYIETDFRLDIAEFEERLGQADALDRKDPETARAFLEEAFELWHGNEPFGGLDSPSLNDQAAELKENLKDARELWCALGQELGRHRQVLPALRLLAKENPHRESVYEKLMITLQALGRHAEALEVYETVRQNISRDLGGDPSPALQSLYHRLLGTPSTRSAPAKPTPRIPAESRPVQIPAQDYPGRQPAPQE